MGGNDDEITLRLDGARYRVTPAAPFVFGRADIAGVAAVVGLDEDDMGISGRAGTIEWAWNVWWVVNLSSKRPLLIETRRSGQPIVLEPRQRHAVTSERLTVLVPGAVFTHAIDVSVPRSYTRHLRQPALRTTTGTLTPHQIELSVDDRDVLTALCRGYLEPFPRNSNVPRSYREVAAALGSPWSATAVRKRVERIKTRFADVGVYFDGSQGNHELATYLTVNMVLTFADLQRLAERRAARR
jgi:hypothetical protein